MTMIRTLQSTATVAVLTAALALTTGTTAAGDDAKNIAIGAGAGLIGKMLRGEPLTLEGALKAAVGAAAGSQVGDGSGATVGAVVGGVAGERAFDGIAGVLQGEAAAAPVSAPASAPASGASALGQVAGVAPAAPEVVAVLREGAAGAEACDAASCYPAKVRTSPAVLVRDGGGYLACLGAAGALECYPLAGADR